MQKINILDSSIFNRIAAGEVVDRPAAIVKELIENSIDAGATKITLEIFEGGIKRIKVGDNGSGIYEEDLPRAFMPHATSKIKFAEDLEKIGTLGFRGEALASIAAVSKINMISKPTDQENGQSINVEGGIILNTEPKGSPNGTLITVDNLFYNVPARAKFLKRPKQEETEITNFVARLILANPNIAISYSADDKVIFRSSGRDLEDAIFAVYGKDIAQNTLKISGEYSDLIVSGVIGKPSFAKPNRTYQTLVINGRYVVNSTVAVAVYNAFESYMMKNRFPFFIIYLTIPLDKIDVNVHPKKLDVRFENGQAVYMSVYNSVSDALMNNDNIATLKNNWSENNNASFNTQLKEPLKFESGFMGSSFKQINTKSKLALIEIAPQHTTQNVEQNANNQNVIGKLAETLTDKNFSGVKQDNGLFTGILNNLNTKNTENTNAPLHIDTVIEQKQQSEQSKFTLNTKFNFCGKLFNTYLVFEYEQNAYFIDQHAAHERLLFDQLKSQTDTTNLSRQVLLLPFVLNVNNLETEFLLSNAELINSLGFEIEEFGSGAFKISTVPLTLKDINIGAFFNSVLKDILVLNMQKTSDTVKDMLAQMACKTAIKSGDELSENEAQNLLNKLIENNTTLLCPHGRPVVVVVKRTDIDKWFKRIL
ncbi:MAG: DNA mismatch repair endonuclease MutL [Clostridia bacterium]|nr:DNA mismatch repair endonuclease MutL [Clostridia bacterium]